MLAIPDDPEEGPDPRSLRRQVEFQRNLRHQPLGRAIVSPVDRDVLRRFFDALSPLDRRRLRLPVTVVVDKDHAGDAAIQDEVAFRLLRALGEIPSEREMRDGKLWLSHVQAQALAEDLGEGGDITSRATIAEDAVFTAVMNCREPISVAGIDIAAVFFRRLDPGIKVDLRAKDGDRVEAGFVLMTLLWGRGMERYRKAGV